MKRSASEFFVVLLSLLVPFACAQDRPLRTMDEIKTWHLQAGSSGVDVTLSSYAHAGKPKDTVISFALSEKNPVLTVRQIAGLLEQILSEMPRIGYAPQKVENVVFASWDSDVEFGVTNAVVRSGQWKGCIRRQYCWAIQHVINDYLRSSGVLQPLDSTLGAHSLEQGMIYIDEPACGLVPKSTPRTVEVGAQSLSCGGLIHISYQAK